MFVLLETCSAADLRRNIDLEHHNLLRLFCYTLLPRGWNANAKVCLSFLGIPGRSAVCGISNGWNLKKHIGRKSLRE